MKVSETRANSSEQSLKSFTFVTSSILVSALCLLSLIGKANFPEAFNSKIDYEFEVLTTSNSSITLAYKLQPENAEKVLIIDPTTLRSSSSISESLNYLIKREPTLSSTISFFKEINSRGRALEFLNSEDPAVSYVLAETGMLYRLTSSSDRLNSKVEKILFIPNQQVTNIKEELQNSPWLKSPVNLVVNTDNLKIQKMRNDLPGIMVAIGSANKVKAVTLINFE